MNNKKWFTSQVEWHIIISRSNCWEPLSVQAWWVHPSHQKPLHVQAQPRNEDSSHLSVCFSKSPVCPGVLGQCREPCPSVSRISQLYLVSVGYMAFLKTKEPGSEWSHPKDTLWVMAKRRKSELLVVDILFLSAHFFSQFKFPLPGLLGEENRAFYWSYSASFCHLYNLFGSLNLYLLRTKLR